MKATLIRNVQVVFGDAPARRADVLIVGSYIAKIADPNSINVPNIHVIDGKNLYLFPGVIDDQVHFREPGLTHKAEIQTEAKAAVAGGVTSFMEMPNTVPNAVTIELLEEKYTRASQCSLANYSFYMGTTNDNLEELLKVDPKNVCGIKIFMGSSTGNMLVDNQEVLEKIFSSVKMLIATHCEDDSMIQENLEREKAERTEESFTAELHPIIRDDKACYSSSSFAVELAKKYGTRLHVLHISSGIETKLFQSDIPLEEKKITAEACVHHLYFSSKDYAEKGNFIKWNPAIKLPKDRTAVWNAVLNGWIDVIATDHAPHTEEEKRLPYLQAPSGGPLVQHGLNAMLEFAFEGKISKQKIVQMMCNNPATLFQIEKRGFIREGYYADLVLVDMNTEYTVSKENIFYKCGWSPFEGKTFHSVITHTFVNGNLVYHDGKFNPHIMGKRLTFNR